MNKPDWLPAHLAEEQIRGTDFSQKRGYDAHVTMLFTPPLFGWFDWFIDADPHGGFARIRCSEVYEPCRDMVGWVGAIAGGDFAATLTVNEEGQQLISSP